VGRLKGRPVRCDEGVGDGAEGSTRRGRDTHERAESRDHRHRAGREVALEETLTADRARLVAPAPSGVGVRGVGLQKGQPVRQVVAARRSEGRRTVQQHHDEPLRPCVHRRRAVDTRRPELDARSSTP